MSIKREKMMCKCQGCLKEKNTKMYLIEWAKYKEVAIYCTACAKHDVQDGFKLTELEIKKD